MLFDKRVCTLGEGPMWHPERQKFFWFDIKEKRLLTAGLEWHMKEFVSAAGWLDRDHLFIASRNALLRFNIETSVTEHVADLEADNPVTRSNDGRADPMGGFWIGTMGINLEKNAGAFYRYYRGEVRKLFAPITIPNATCFAPDGRTAYFTDTPKRRVWKTALDAQGWPIGEWEVFANLVPEQLNPDGAVVDAQGNVWIALWGVGRIDGFDPDGNRIEQFQLPAMQTTCPAFGGPDLTQMLVTSAADGLDAAALDKYPQSGCTFLINTELKGQAEHQVIL